MFIERRNFIRIVSFLCAVIVVLTGACIYINYQKVNFARAVSNDYISSFDELSSHIYNIEAAFYKGLYSNSPYQSVKMATKVWGEAMAAKTNIEGMYGYSNELSQISEFLSKSSDFAYYTALKRLKNEQLSSEEIDNLNKLATTASMLSERISDISRRLNNGELQYDEITINTLAGESFTADADMLSSDLVSSVDQVSSYPELIYDGPFSDHIEKQESVFLKDKGEITREEAVTRLSKWFDIPQTDIVFAYENDSKIASFVFNFGEYTASVSKQGGYLVELVCSNVFMNSRINAEEAIEIAEDFLNKIGMESMEENYYYSLNNEITINFAYEQNDVVVYPDLIKVNVSLETGEITGYEAFGYLMAHKDNRETTAEISAEEAKKGVNSSLTVQDEGVAIIPTDGKNEVLCYEFVTKAPDNRRVLVYINAKNGVEEMLQILIENDNGTLAE